MHRFVLKYKKLFLGLFLPKKNPVQDFSQKIIWDNVKPLCCCNLMQKKQKTFTNWFFIKLEKPHFQPVFGSFWPINFKTKLFQKKSILILYAIVTFCNNKWEKFWELIFHKTSILGPIRIFFLETLKYCFGVQQGQSYLIMRRCLFSLSWSPF